MANNDVKTNVSITLTGKEAENQIEHLKSKADELRKKLEAAQKALNPDAKEIKRLNSELKSVEKNFFHSITSLLHYSITPSLHHFITTILHVSQVSRRLFLKF